MKSFFVISEYSHLRDIVLVNSSSFKGDSDNKIILLSDKLAHHVPKGASYKVINPNKVQVINSILTKLRLIYWFELYRMSGKSETVKQKIRELKYPFLIKIIYLLFFKGLKYIDRLLVNLYWGQVDFSFIGNNRIVIVDPFIFNHQNLAIYFKSYLKLEKIDVVIRSWDNLTCKGLLFPTFDNYFVWNDFMKKELTQYYDIESDRIEICGGIQFQAFSTLRTSRPQKKHILFNLGYNSLYPNQIFHLKTVYDILKEFGFADKLLVRIQPGRRSIGLKEQIVKEVGDIQIYDTESEFRFGNIDQRSLYREYIKQLIDSSIVISFPSTSTIDAAFFNKNSIVLAFEDDSNLKRYLERTHYKWLLGIGGFAVIREKKVLKNKLREYLFLNENKDLYEKIFLKMNGYINPESTFNIISNQK